MQQFLFILFDAGGGGITVGFNGLEVDNITLRLYLKVFKTNVFTYTALFKKIGIVVFISA